MSDFKPPVPSNELIDVRTSLDTKHRKLVKGELVERFAIPQYAAESITDGSFAPAIPLDIRSSIETQHRKLPPTAISVESAKRW